jgi:hypothetical protein
MKELLKTYLRQNYSPDTMLFLPHFKKQQVEKIVPAEIKAIPALVITKPTFPAKPKLIVEPKKQTIVLEKPKPVDPSPPSSKMATLIHQVAPQLFLHKEAPRDDYAKQIKTEFLLPKFPLFYSKNLEAHRPFLENIAKALESLTRSSRLVDIEPIEKQNLFEEGPFSCIIAADETIFSSSHLIAHFRETPASGKRWLGNVPLFLLPDLALYKKDHNLKRALWLELKLCMQQFS